MDDPSALWNPLPSPKCDGDDSEVNRKCVDTLSEIFCEATDENNEDHFSKVIINHDLEDHRTTNNPAMGEERIELQKRSPPASSNTCEGWEFKFTWDTTKGARDWHIDCKDTYSRLGKECGRDGAWRNGMGGVSMDTSCGRWNYSIKASSDPSEDYVTATKPSGPAKCYKSKVVDKCLVFDSQPWIAHSKSYTFYDDHGDGSMYYSWDSLKGSSSSKDFIPLAVRGCPLCTIHGSDPIKAEENSMTLKC